MTRPLEYLDESYRDDVIASALLLREQEIFHYEFDIENFTHILANTEDADLRAQMTARIAETERELKKSRGIFNALRAQVKDPAKHTEALARVKSKIAAGK